MTNTECEALLKLMNWRVYVLALVATVDNACRAHCAPVHKSTFDLALDVARRLSLDQVDEMESWAASDKARAAADRAGADTAMAAETVRAITCAADVVWAAAMAACFFDRAAAARTASALLRELTGETDRRLVIESLRAVEFADVVVTHSGWVISQSHVWVPKGALGGCWLRRTEVHALDMVRLDLELAAGRQA